MKILTTCNSISCFSVKWKICFCLTNPRCQRSQKVTSQQFHLYILFGGMKLCGWTRDGDWYSNFWQGQNRSGEGKGEWAKGMTGKESGKGERWNRMRELAVW